MLLEVTVLDVLDAQLPDANKAARKSVVLTIHELYVLLNGFYTASPRPAVDAAG